MLEISKKYVKINIDYCKELLIVNFKKKLSTNKRLSRRYFDTYIKLMIQTKKKL